MATGFSVQSVARGKPLRVALILAELRPGGMERVVVHLASGLSKRKITAMVVCLQEPGALAPELENAGVRLEAIRSLTGKDVGAVWRLGGTLRRFHPSILHVHDYASVPYAVLAGLLCGRPPLLFTAHGLLFQGFEKLRVRYRFFSRFFSGITAVSNQVAERHKEYLGWSGPVQMIPNGVPMTERDPKLRETVRKELGCGPRDVMFLAVGNPRPEKGFEDLIEATRLLRDRLEGKEEFLVAIAGKWSESEYCQMLVKRVEDSGLEDRCRFLGFRSDTTALYSAADAFVLSSRSEGLPMVLLEAMMIGLPVVATRVGGIPEAVHENGLLVDPASPDELSEAMHRVMLNPELASRLASKGREQAQAVYSIDRMVDEYIGCYGKTTGRSSRP